MTKKQISEKQLIANRKNAKKGGVKTLEGKMISKMNAVTHGLTAKLLIDKEEKKEYLQICNHLNETYSPQGFEEQLLVEEITACVVRRNRAQRLESAAVAKSKLEAHHHYHKTFSMFTGPDLLKLTRYGRYVPKQLLEDIAKREFKAKAKIEDFSKKQMKESSIDIFIKIEKYGDHITKKLFKLIEKLNMLQKKKMGSFDEKALS